MESNDELIDSETPKVISKQTKVMDHIQQQMVERVRKFHATEQVTPVSSSSQVSKPIRGFGFSGNDDH